MQILLNKNQLMLQYNVAYCYKIQRLLERTYGRNKHQNLQHEPWWIQYHNLKPNAWTAEMNRLNLLLKKHDWLYHGVGNMINSTTIKPRSLSEFTSDSSRDVCCIFLICWNTLYKDSWWATLFWFPGKPERHSFMEKDTFSINALEEQVFLGNL